MSFFRSLMCSKSGSEFPIGKLYNLSPKGAPLLAQYDLDLARTKLTKKQVTQGPHSLWRYKSLLPLQNLDNLISLGEGDTPLIPISRYGQHIGATRLLIKDESTNPTGTFKARGMTVAISMAKELGVTKVATPSAGNAASALAAYAAAANMEAHIFMPTDTPRANYIECKIFGAAVTLVDGLISDCGAIVTERKHKEGWFDISTLKEPYRVEGKKTMGLELAEQLNWRLPDAILYPTGGGVGIIGMWKAFDELERLGWIDKKRPKMIAVQSTGCAPIVKAFEQGMESSCYWEEASTLAAGLRVPKAIGDFLVLQSVSESHGTCLAVTDQELLSAGHSLAEREGFFVAPEGAACCAALEKLLQNNFLDRDEEIVIFNTGTGLKYLDEWTTQIPQASDRS
ncbi:MAG: threonine synthase [Solibacterales bacterium]|nr:threonine synthase [Bryobacterales bacterium]